jgi:hypothetical protein
MDRITQRLAKELLSKLEAIAEALRHVSNPQSIRKDHPTPNTHRESNIETNNSNPDIPPLPCVSSPPPAKACYEGTQKEEKDWWDKTKPFVEIGGVVLLFVYTIYTIKMYRANKESADAAKQAADVAENSFRITKRHTEDADEAIAQMRGEPEPGGNIETITVSNIGKVSAHNFSAHIEISRNRLPSNERISQLGLLDISQEEIRINTPITRRVVLTDIGKADWERIGQIREAIVVKATMQYENGFDEIRHPTYCQEFLVQLPHPGNIPQTPSNVLVDCTDLFAYFERERAIQAQKH